MLANVITVSDYAHPVASRKIAPLRRGRRLRALDPKWKGKPYICLVNGEAVARAAWNRRVRDGDIVVFVNLPPRVRGGGGGSSPLKIVLMVALAVAAPQLGLAMAEGMGLAGAEIGLGITYAQAFGMAVSFVGNQLINALMGSPKPPSTMQMQSMASPSPTYSLNAQGNRARLMEAIPKQYGRHIMYPDFAAEPYMEYAGEDQYLYQLFCLGLGEMHVEEIRIEDTPISSFPEVTYQIVRPGDKVTLFPTNVITAPEVSGQELLPTTIVGPFVANTAGTQTDTIIVDIVCPKGLFYANDDGGLDAMTVAFKFEIRQIDDNGTPIGDWQAVLQDKTFYYSNYWSKGYWISSGGNLGWNYSKTWHQVDYGTTNSADHQDGQAAGGYVSAGTNNKGWPVSTPVIWRWAPFGTDPHPTREYVAAVPDITITAATNTPIRRTYKFPVAAGRYQVRATRTNDKSGSSRAAHDIIWGALRSHIPDDEIYGNVTLLAMKARATNSLSSQSSRRVNVIQTACLPIWNGTEWIQPTPTRSIAWAAADALRADYGGKVPNNKINLDKLMELDAVWSARGDTFDGIFDSRMALFEAESQILRVGRAKTFQQGGVWQFVRDQAQTMPSATFGMRNIVKGSVKVNYVMHTDETPDCVDVQFFNEQTWTWDTVRAKPADSQQLRPTKLKIVGITNRAQAWREGMYEWAANRYRRIPFTIQTEMEGYIPTFGDLVTVSHDRARWGQSGELVGWDAGTLTAITSEPLDFSAGGTHYIGLRRRDGTRAGPYQVVAGTDAHHVVLQTAPDFTPYVGWQEERTHYQFGPGELHSKKAIVTAIKPRSPTRVEIALINDDAAVHTADTGAAPPVSTSWNLPAVITRPVISAINVTLGGTAGTPLCMVALQGAAGAEYYIAEYSYDNGASWNHLSRVSSNFSFPARVGQVVVRAAGVSGLAAGEWTTWTGNPMGTPLPNVQGLATVYRDGNSYLIWRAVVDPRAGEYEVRFGPAWESAHILARTGALELPAVGNGTYWVAARYSSVYSAVPASIVITGATLTRNVIATFDEAATGWSGTVADGALLSGGNIILQGAGDILAVADFLALDDVLWYGGVAASGTYELPAGHAVDIGRVAPCMVTVGYTIRGQAINDDVLSLVDFLAATDLLGSVYGPRVMARPQIALAADDGVYGAWQDLIPGTYLARHYKARILLMSADTTVTAVLSGLTFAVDVPDRVDDFNVTLDAAGSAVLYAPAFNGGVSGNPYPLPQITILNAQAGDDLILSAQSKTGFTAQVKNGGAGVSRTINCRPQGY